MRKGKLVFLLRTIVLFILAVALMLEAGYYRKSLKESGSIHLELEDDTLGKSQRPVIFDVREEGLSKKIFQPGRISISTGHGGGILNKTSKPLHILIKAKGLPKDTVIKSNDPAFLVSSLTFKKPIAPGKAFDLSIELAITRSHLAQKEILKNASIELYDAKSNQFLSSIPIRIINSKYS